MPEKLRILTIVLSIILSSLAPRFSFAQMVSEGMARQAAETFLLSQKSLQEMTCTPKTGPVGM